MLEWEQTALEECLAAVHKRHPQLRIAVTRGADGVLALDKDGKARRLAAIPVEAVDTLGAGDVFHGTTTLMLAEGIEFFAAMRFATAAAAIKCERLAEDQLPQREEIEERLAAHSIEWV